MSVHSQGDLLIVGVFLARHEQQDEAAAVPAFRDAGLDDVAVGIDLCSGDASGESVHDEVVSVRSDRAL
jgi:hypothetical protein